MHLTEKINTEGELFLNKKEKIRLLTHNKATYEGRFYKYYVL